MANYNVDVFVGHLEKWRRENGVSQENMAHHIGVTRNHYARIISKKLNFEETRFSTFLNAADFLGISLDALVGHQVNKDPKSNWWLPNKKAKNNE